MATPSPGIVLRHLRDLVATEQTNKLPDQQLLQRFVRTREESAFDTLVRRHGPLVLGVCRRVLHDWHDAEDAFQATFLVLARNAGSVQKGASLGSWLYGTAYRVAVKARGRSATRQHYEGRAAPGRPAGDPLAEVSGRELLTVLDEELQQLPERYRAPLVLCYLEGQTCDEAARNSGCSTRTLKRRLDQARDRLRRRLTRRGLALSGALLTTGLTQGAAAAVPPTLHRSAVRSAVEAPAPVLSSYLPHWTPGRFRVAACLLVGLAALGVGVFACLNAPQPEQDAPAPRQKAAAPAAQPPAEGEQKINVKGRVLDAAGRALKDADVVVLSMPKSWDKTRGEFGLKLVTQAKAQTDPRGEFTVRVPPPSDDQNYPTVLVARAPGHGLSWAAVKAGAAKDAFELRLPAEQVLRGRLIDLQGEPIKNVPVRVLAVMDDREEGVRGVLQPSDPGKFWFAPLRTDAQGRFQLRGVGAKQTPYLQVEDSRYQGDKLTPWKTDADRSSEVAVTLAPARLLTGRVTYADTGKPVANAEVTVQQTHVRTDQDGRYRFTSWEDNQGPILVRVQSPAGSPYLHMARYITKLKGPARQATEDFRLPRGVPVRGKLIEAGTGKPVAGADVYYIPRRADNPFYLVNASFGPANPVPTAKDGTYTLNVLPGPGHLLVKGPRPDYVLQEFGMNQLSENKPGGQRWYAHGHRATDYKPGDEPKDADIVLRRGVTVRGKVLDPDGKPAASAEMLSRLLFSAPRFIEEPRPEPVPAGGFVFGGCDPDRAYRVVFLDQKNHRGATLELSGKDAGEPLAMKLQPCGKAVVRFLDGEGKPLENYWPEVEMVFAPGPHRFSRESYEKGVLSADVVSLANVARRDYQIKDFRTDAKGLITLPDLVPGVPYRISAMQLGGKVLREFTVRPGETLDLKDITVSRGK
jgi:RNA polymerase sigma factor (sigma-70 family)